MEQIREAVSQMRERLSRQVQDRDSTNPSSDACPDCEGRGYRYLVVDGDVGVRRCECLRKRIVDQKLSEIPERFRGSTFENYVPTDAKQETARNAIQLDFTRSFYLYGDYARGKTHLATAQYRQLIEIERPALFMSMGELLADLRKAETNDEYFCLVRQRVRYADNFHLFVDDIDKFKGTEFKTEVLFDLFDTIYKRKLGVTITSNCTLAELRGIHPSIVRRIDDTCQALEV
jgi:DNA replication protein DnaC